jgi:hypothetical protein
MQTGAVVTLRDNPILQALPGSIVTHGGSTADCHTLIETGWSGDCGRRSGNGTNIAWIVQYQPLENGSNAYVIKIFDYLDLAGGWVGRLQGQNLAGGWRSASVKPAELTGRGPVELVVAVQPNGPAESLSYDVTSMRGNGSLAVAFHTTVVNQGVLVVDAGKVDEYGGVVAEGAKCCSSFQHRRVEWNGSKFRATILGQVEADQVPRGNL